MQKKIEQRIKKLEAGIPPLPESGGRVDSDALNQGFIQAMENMRLLAEHTDPFVRLRHHCEKIQEAEQALLTKEKTVTGHALAELCLPIDHHSARDAELEMLEQAGFDTGELRAKHQKHAANPYKWPYRDNPLPSEAQTILDRISHERN